MVREKNGYAQILFFDIVMLLTGHQPNYLPYAGFFEKVARADKFLIVDHVQFVKRGPFGWINRNRIRTGSIKNWDWLIVPVHTKGRYTQSIRETAIDNDLPWARKNWKSIEWNYKKARYFGDYAPDLRAVYEKKWDWLVDLNVELITLILRWLGLPEKCLMTSDLKIEGQATELVINMCKAMGADAYLSGTHGQDYLEEPRFEQEKIKLIYQDFKPTPYPQCFPEPFVPNMSIIDLLMNCGLQSREVLRGAEFRVSESSRGAGGRDRKT